MLSSYLLLAITLLVGIFQIEKLFPESFKAKPWIILSLLVVLTVFSFINEYYKGEDAKEAIIAANKKDHNRDLIADLKIKESNQLILDGFGKAIGKYSLGYDTAKQEIVALQKLIKDSANRKTTIIQGDNPTINFKEKGGIIVDSFTNDIIRVEAYITSYSASSILKYATVYSFVSPNPSNKFDYNLKYYNSLPYLNKNLGIPKNASYGGGIYITGVNLKHLKTIIILIKGSYTDSYGRNPQQLDIVGLYDLISKEFGTVASPFDDSVREILKRNDTIK